MFWIGLHKPDQLWQWRSDNSNVTEFTDWANGYVCLNECCLDSVLQLVALSHPAYLCVACREGNGVNEDYVLADCDSDFSCQWRDDGVSSQRPFFCTFQRGKRD